MAKWIRRPARKEWVEWFLLFQERGASRGSGYLFPCNESGKVDESDLAPEGLANYKACATGHPDFEPGAVVRHERSYFDSGAIRCRCGAAHELERGDSVCESCGLEFNAVGQELAPRHLWEE